MRVRLELRQVELDIGRSGARVHYNLVLTDGEKERHIRAEPSDIALDGETATRFERALESLNRDLSGALGLRHGLDDDLAEEDDLLDDPEILDATEEEEAL